MSPLAPPTGTASQACWTYPRSRLTNTSRRRRLHSARLRSRARGKSTARWWYWTPEQRRAVDDALAGYPANYEAAWEVGEIEDYYLFPGSKMRMLDNSGRRLERRCMFFNWFDHPFIEARLKRQLATSCLTTSHGDAASAPQETPRDARPEPLRSTVRRPDA